MCYKKRTFLLRKITVSAIRTVIQNAQFIQICGSNR